MLLYPRFLADRIERALFSQPAVFVEGARQVGKTTLVRQLAEARSMRYVTLDELDVLAAATVDPEGLLASLGRPLVIDEVQRAPELMLALKAAIDRQRTPGSYLLTGSANVLALPRVSEALVGRMAVLTLFPLSQGEIERTREGFLRAAFAGSPPLDWPEVSWRELLRGGGYPEPLGMDREERREWYSGYVRTLLERDVRDISGVEQIAVLQGLLTLLAERTASLLNVSELARTLGRPRSTTEKYLRLFEKLFLFTRLPAWGKSATKRLVRSPKLHLIDSGLAAHLQLRENLGSLLETFVVMELYKQASFTSERYALSHYRSAAGSEVDVVVESKQGLVGIEVKASGNVSAADFKGLRSLRNDAGDAFAAGYVIYTGGRALPFGERLWALPLAALWRWGSKSQ